MDAIWFLVFLLLSQCNVKNVRSLPTQFLRLTWTIFSFSFFINNFPLFNLFQTLLLTVIDMMKLEKVEFGGVRGRALSQQVVQLHEEFLERYKIFTEKPYDCLDVCNTVCRSDILYWCRETESSICSGHALLNSGLFQEFEANLAEFERKAKDTDRRLGAIFCQAFDDASGLEHAFKVSGSLRLLNNSDPVSSRFGDFYIHTSLWISYICLMKL